MELRTADFARILGSLVTEAYVGPPDPRTTWFVDNEADCGILGTLSALDAAGASAPLAGSPDMSVARHAWHLRFSLNLANRALRGADVHASADWKASWKVTTVDEAAWRELLAGLRNEYDLFLEAIRADLPWSDEMNLTGVLGQLAHGAWHLGAIRQGLGLVAGPD
ncbi:MAG: hypothetical protein NT080_02205 [Spirochaetes bacterium]|nr:hypothetical protein [Spirochaetota bacterium]